MLTPAEAAVLLSMSRDMVYKLMRQLDPETRRPRLYWVKVGRLKMIPRQALEDFAAVGS